MTKPLNLSEQTINELIAYIENLIKSRDDTIGIAIAITNDKELLWAEGFGYTDHTKTEKVTAETLFSSQSIGKTFTATVFLILASKGLIALDDPIRKYYPPFKIRTIHGDPDKEIAKMTFRKMLSHTAGLTHEAPKGNNFDYSPCSFEEHIESISEWWLKSPVGKEMSYSNLGYDLTAYVMGLVKNTSFEKVMIEELLLPLGMRTTTLSIEEAQKKSFAKGYEGKYPYPVVQVPMLGAGGLLFNVLDVVKFIIFHLRRGSLNHEQMIDFGLFEEMYKTTSNNKSEYGYGLGIYAANKIAGSLVYGHAGGGYGYQTNMMWIPEHKIGVVVLSNNMKNSRAGSIVQKALNLITNEPEKQETEKEFIKPKFEKISASLLKRFEGTYTAENNLTSPMIRIALENNSLFIYDIYGDRSELYPISPTIFTTEKQRIFEFKIDQEEQPKKVFVDNNLFPYDYKYNAGPSDKEGRNLEEWSDYQGIYEFEDEAKPNYLSLSIENGHLYLFFNNKFRLQHHKENLFFTADGEALLINQKGLIFKGIHASKVDFDIAHFITKVKQSEYKIDYYFLAVSSLVNILNNVHDFETAQNFLLKIIKIEKEYVNILLNFGKKLFFIGKYQQANNCFKNVLELNYDNTEAKKMIDRIENFENERKRR